MEKAVILSTGDELTTGRVVDTNSAYIANRFYSLGLRVVAVLTVGDEKERLFWALRQGLELGDVVIGTGGLGPTVDDLTTEAVAQLLGRKLKRDDNVAESLERRFEARRLPWTRNNLKQALFPEGAEIIPNPRGTAPGFRIAAGPGKCLLWLSGVPVEMTEMLEKTVLPWLIRESGGGLEIHSCTYKIHGLTESRLDEALKPVQLPDEARLSFRAHFPDLTLRLSLRGGEGSLESFRRLKTQIEERIRPHIYAERDETLEEIVGRLLRGKGWTLSLAESCTGGYLSHRITRVAGSSDYFRGGSVTYSNEAKVLFLGVNSSTLERHGPVSREVALEMARGVREKSDATLGLGVTGIAGPTGGTPETPVGTVWIAVSQPEGEEARSFRFYGDRERVIMGASQAALNWLRTVLL